MPASPMTRPMLLLALPLLFGAAAASAQQPDSAAYVVRFGTDTVAMERWVRTAEGLVAESVTRSPSTTTRRWSVRFDAAGNVSHVTTSEGTSAVAPAGAVPSATGFYAPQAIAFAQAARARDTLAVVPLLVSGNTRDFRVRRIGPDLFESIDDAGSALSRVRLTKEGQLLFLEAGSTTVERVPWFDIAAWAADFAARDARGEAFGPLSTQGTAELVVGGAAISIEYGRPAARGRTVFGGLVPFGRVWRAGANDPTRLVVDRAVRVGDVRLEAGAYTLYVIPGRDSWTLGINRGTDMAAAMAPDPAQDAGRTRMSVRPASRHVERFTILLEPTAAGAVLRMQWEDTEASVPIVVAGGE
jgi:hypothetical protein